jgi:hypothetical protein
MLDILLYQYCHLGYHHAKVAFAVVVPLSLAIHLFTSPTVLHLVADRPSQRLIPGSIL